MEKKFQNSPAEKKPERKYTWLTAVRDFAIFLVIFLVLFRGILGISLVRGSSMEETISDGTVVIFSRIVPEYQVGDVVAAEVSAGKLYVKRIVAGPGAVLELIDGILYIDGHPEPQGHARGDSCPLEGGVEFPYTVGQGEYFLMGDNREHSRDSRAFGALPEENLKGKLIGY